MSFASSFQCRSSQNLHNFRMNEDEKEKEDILDVDNDMQTTYNR